MNKKVILIFLLTFAALVILYLYSFGSLANSRTAKNFNPASLKPISTPSQPTAATQDILDTYTNKDVRENYYSILLPHSWQVSAGKTPGSYSANFASGTASVELMDVPDNSTLELFILSQDEPKLKTSLTDYKRVEYNTLTINGDEAYQLVYTAQIKGVPTKEARTYIAGADHAGLIIFSSDPMIFDRMKTQFVPVFTSFSWQKQPLRK